MRVHGYDGHYLKVIFFSLLTFATTSTLSSQNTTCPFKYLHVFGDGFSDIGNSIRIPPWGRYLPAARLPYGKTFPGMPTGRWSDGLIDVDFVAKSYGTPNVTPYLSMSYKSKSDDGVILSVANSPVLDRKFFESRGVFVPPYAVSLSGQLRWFKSYRKSICRNKPKECTNILRSSLVVFGDAVGHDMVYPLTQGKSIHEVKSYIPFIIHKTIEVGRELIKMGAPRVIFSGNIPGGCLPYTLTKLRSTNRADYDDLGCSKSVNDLVQFKNNVLQQAVKNISMEFPYVDIYFADIYPAARTIIKQTTISEGNALKACCGIGGRYNFDESRFCGSRGVPVCSNPNKYIFWDGIHFTQEAYDRFISILVPGFLPLLNCTT